MPESPDESRFLLERPTPHRPAGPMQAGQETIPPPRPAPRRENCSKWVEKPRRPIPTPSIPRWAGLVLQLDPHSRWSADAGGEQSQSGASMPRLGGFALAASRKLSTGLDGVGGKVTGGRTFCLPGARLPHPTPTPACLGDGREGAPRCPPT